MNLATRYLSDRSGVRTEEREARRQPPKAPRRGDERSEESISPGAPIKTDPLIDLVQGQKHGFIEDDEEVLIRGGVSYAVLANARVGANGDTPVVLFDNGHGHAHRVLVQPRRGDGAQFSIGLVDCKTEIL